METQDDGDHDIVVAYGDDVKPTMTAMTTAVIRKTGQHHQHFH